MKTSERRRPSLRRSFVRSVSNLSQRLQRLGSNLSAKSVEKDISVLTAQVKAEFYHEYSKNKDIYNSKDVQMILENDDFNYVQRYLERTGLNAKKALEMVRGTLKWFKDEGLSDLTAESFPNVFYKYGIFFIYGEDRQGNNVIYVRYKLYHKFHPAAVDAFEKYLFYSVFKIDQMSSTRKKNWVVVCDLSGVSPRQADLKHLLMLLKVYLNYCPAGLKKAYVCGVNWLIKPIFKGFLAVLPSSLAALVTVIDKDDLWKFIPEDNLPKILGGTCEKDPREAPANCVGDEEFFRERYNVPPNEFREIMQKYQKVIDSTEW